LRSALIADGRFRFVDAQADELLARELALVEAGYVDRVTAAAAGRRLACRYVIAGTMNRSDHEAECFLRLVRCDSGRVVASADAYQELRDPADADRLFAATAGRLRQVFPVQAGAATHVAGRVRVAGGRASGAVACMRVHLYAEPPSGERSAPPIASMEIDEVLDDAALGQLAGGAGATITWGVGE
jgi:TolB-like protein